MTIEDFLNSIDEDVDIQIELSDQEIVDLIKELKLDSTKNQFEAEKMENISSPYFSLFIREQIFVFI